MNLPERELSTPIKIAELPSSVNRIDVSVLSSHPVSWQGLTGMKEPAFSEKQTEDGSIVWSRTVNAQSLSQSIAAQEVEDEALRAQWALGDYEDYSCPNCGRQRVCKCPNGKHRCEKCNWVPEDRAFAPVSNR
jgi:predicted RNA-binding Zn-ribbon protein involved in translation (DUF1610 family)